MARPRLIERQTTAGRFERGATPAADLSPAPAGARAADRAAAARAGPAGPRLAGPHRAAEAGAAVRPVECSSAGGPRLDGRRTGPLPWPGRRAVGPGPRRSLQRCRARDRNLNRYAEPAG